MLQDLVPVMNKWLAPPKSKKKSFNPPRWTADFATVCGRLGILAHANHFGYSQVLDPPQNVPDPPQAPTPEAPLKEIIIVSHKKKKTDPKYHRVDVTSKSDSRTFRMLSPMYANAIDHPVPCMESMTSRTVEGLWQGLKVCSFLCSCCVKDTCLRSDTHLFACVL